MTRLRLEDLPPKVRAQAERKLADTPSERPAGTETARKIAREILPSYRCVRCPDVEIVGVAALERHSRETGHPRYEQVLS